MVHGMVHGVGTVVNGTVVLCMVHGFVALSLHDAEQWLLNAVKY